MAASLLSERCSLFLCCFFCFVTYLVTLLCLSSFESFFLFTSLHFPFHLFEKNGIIFYFLHLSHLVLSFLHTLRHRHHIVFSVFDIVSDSTYYIPPAARRAGIALADGNCGIGVLKASL
ncbi:hypothetical protein HDV64DRAFT_66077 [Trichoderma sp. TUCIM 5745]